MANRRKISEVERWMKKKVSVSMTELIVQCNGWTCECCGSDSNLDAYELNTDHIKDENGNTVFDHRNENLICLCPQCYRKYNGNTVEALRHMQNPQIFSGKSYDPRIERYCK